MPLHSPENYGPYVSRRTDLERRRSKKPKLSTHSPYAVFRNRSRKGVHGLVRLVPGVGRDAVAAQISDPGESVSGVSWGLCQLPDGIYAPDPKTPQWTPYFVRFDCDP